MTARALPDALVEAAGYFQEQVDRIWWPTGPDHDVGLHDEVRNFSPVWWCRVRDHALAAIGVSAVRTATSVGFASPLDG